MSHARAALAGALVMLLGIWIMNNDQSSWTTQDVVFAVVALLVVVMLLVGVDVRRKWSSQSLPKDDKEEEA